MRRTYRLAIPFTPTIQVGELEIDILNRHVRAGTSDPHLTSVKQSLLYLLAANAVRLLSREEILDALWGVDYVADSTVVDRHIRSLRANLQNDHPRARLPLHSWHHRRGHRPRSRLRSHIASGLPARMKKLHELAAGRW